MTDLEDKLDTAIEQGFIEDAQLKDKLAESELYKKIDQIIDDVLLHQTAQPDEGERYPYMPKYRAKRLIRDAVTTEILKYIATGTADLTGINDVCLEEIASKGPGRITVTSNTHDIAKQGHSLLKELDEFLDPDMKLYMVYYIRLQNYTNQLGEILKEGI